jgi:20S proteasome alpha/beta subunit
MTALVGLFCTDGVVIGADSSSTFSSGTENTIEQPTEKICVIEGRVIFAGTGEVGLNQRFEAVLQKTVSGGLKGTSLDISKDICRNALIDFEYTGRRPGGIGFGALVAFPVNHKPHLCECALQTFQPEMKTEKHWFASMGSHQKITDAFLGYLKDVFWPSGPPSLQDGVFAAIWTLEHVIALNTGGINGPIRIAILENKEGKAKARMLADSELDQHKQSVDEAKQHMRKFRDKFQPGASPSDVPKLH